MFLSNLSSTWYIGSRFENQAWNQTEHARPSGSAWWRKPSPSSPIGCSAEPSRARAIGSCHRASRTEHAQPPSRAKQTLRSVCSVWFQAWLWTVCLSGFRPNSCSYSSQFMYDADQKSSRFLGIGQSARGVKIVLILWPSEDTSCEFSRRSTVKIRIDDQISSE